MKLLHITHSSHGNSVFSHTQKRILLPSKYKTHTNVYYTLHSMFESFDCVLEKYHDISKADYNFYSGRTYHALKRFLDEFFDTSSQTTNISIKLIPDYNAQAKANANANY